VPLDFASVAEARGLSNPLEGRAAGRVKGALMKPEPFLINADQAWGFGTSPEYLKEFLAYWQNQFDWRKAEASLNEFSQFKAEIAGSGIHSISRRRARLRGS
jgi:hypothetical protein